MTKIFYPILLLFLFGSVNAADVSNETDWQQYIAKFRSEHNFSLITGQASGQWHVQRFGPITDKTYVSQASFIKFRYDFYLPLYGPFGYTLGSSLGYFYQFKSQDPEFRPTSAVHWPGLAVGGVCQFNASWRAILGIESYLIQPHIIYAGEGSAEVGLKGLMFTYQDLYLALDSFYSLNWASRFELHSRVVEYHPPDGSKNLVEDVAFNQHDFWMVLGLTYHLI